MSARLTSGRVLRPLALALVCAAVVYPPATAASRVPPTQLVVLLRAHAAHKGPALRTPLVEVVPARTPITNAETVLPVLAQRGHWLKVRLPGRPNSHTGWIKQGATLKSWTRQRIVVNTSRRTVTVYRSGRVERTFKAVVGKPSTPTPTGKFYVEESVSLHSYDVGAPFALALSARSNVFQEFDGGPGQIAIHGLQNVGGTPGTATSHGCVRLDNDAMRWLAARIVLGTPVTITAH